jgi:hypothetical protein
MAHFFMIPVYDSCIKVPLKERILCGNIYSQIFTSKNHEHHKLVVFTLVLIDLFYKIMVN